MAALRFIPMLLVLFAVQVGLWSALSALFLPRPGQAPERRKLALGLAGLAIFFLGFLIASRSGLQLAAPAREFVVEPLLAVEALSIPLMLLLGFTLSVARRVPPVSKAGELAEPRRIFLRRAATGLIAGTGAAAIVGIEQAELAPQLTRHAAAPGEPRILLAHRPSLFELCANAGAQLVLSGHTHGGQIALSPTWSLARLLGPYTMGLYQRKGSLLYVHRGMGTVGPAPVRLGSQPEIALLTLRRV